jgi:hypothetical protein
MVVVLERGRKSWWRWDKNKRGEDRGMMVDGNVEEGWLDDFSSKLTYM